MTVAEKYNPGVATDHVCKRCGFTANGTDQTLRVQGWRIWAGVTTTGQPLSVVACPPCVDGTPADAGEERGGYDAECATCGATMAEEEDDGEGGDPFTREDAQQWCRRHKCEPDTIVIEPKTADRNRVTAHRSVETTRSL